ncbi:MAG: hypothetical protein J6I40_05155 [Mailhella sp.]|nr:hypothetical protein [Mailhella sp.]
MCVAFLAEAATKHPALFKAIIAFNRRYAPSASVPEYFSMLPGHEKLLQDKEVRSICLKIHQPFRGWWNFAEESTRFALLDTETLKKLCLFFSTAVMAEDIAHAVKRDEATALKQSLGINLYLYAIKRGRYQIGGIRSILIPFAGTGNLFERIERLSGKLLFLVCGSWPENLKNFLLQYDAAAFGFLEGTPGTSTEHELSPDAQRSLRFAMKKILFREVSPQWALCFD